MADEQDTTEETSELPEHLEGVVRSLNLADYLPDEKLDEIGAELKEQVERDINSRQGWLEKVDKWEELTTQVMENKTFPWPGASNIKFPLLSTAAVQFHARAFPSLFGTATPVRGKVIGNDPVGDKAARANRVSSFMNYQLLYDMDGWLDDQDRLLLILPIIGAVYKKVYFNPRTASTVSELIHPRDFIINYDAQDFDNCRKTHRLWKSPNQIKEMQNRMIYRQFEGDDNMAPPKVASEARDKTQGLTNAGVDDPYALQELYEVHCILDLDDDGYAEPYIVTIRETDGKVFRIIQAFNDSEVVQGDEGDVIAIEAKTYFTSYFFLPDPESKTHGIGFGTMIGPINEAVNTIVNQLTDAGTLSNLQGGFLGRGIRLRGGDTKFKPGEWKTVNATGDDLRKGIFPMPTREPSNVLFQLLGLLIDSGKDLSSVQDMMVGRNPGQNQPFSTSQMVMEQGLKVFNGIYKRIYRSLSREFMLLYKANSEHLDLEHYMVVLDEAGEEVGPAMQEHGPQQVMQYLSRDFNLQDLDVIPTAEPDMVAEIQKAMKAEALLQKVAAGLPLNPLAVTRRMLEAEQHENIEELLQMPEAPPNPEVIFKEKELEIKGAEAQIKALVAEADVALKEVQAEVMILQAQGQSVEKLHQQFIAEKEQNRKQFEAATSRLKAMSDANKDRETGGEAGASEGESN